MDDKLKALLDEHAGVIARYNALKAQIKALEKEFNPLKEELLKVPEFVRISTRKGVDLQILKEVYPEVHELVQKTTETRTLIV
jgi:predicted nuclease with TOPRIM domain